MSNSTNDYMNIAFAVDAKYTPHLETLIKSICYHNKRRFSDILNDVVGISNKMLSKELKELEMNKLIIRTVLDTQPISVQYQLTEHGRSLQTIINNLTDWGKTHREMIIST